MEKRIRGRVAGRDDLAGSILRAANRGSMRSASHAAMPGEAALAPRPATRRRGWRGFGLGGSTIVTCALATFLAVYTAPDWLPRETLAPVQRALSIPGAGAGGAQDTERAQFGLCHSGGGTHCVVDGDTFWYRGEKIRIADIDTPETHEPGCADEAQKGEAATRRLQGLLNAGAFTLEPIDRDTDRYGRKLRTVTRGGESLGGVLVGEGLARWYGNGRRGWC